MNRYPDELSQNTQRIKVLSRYWILAGFNIAIGFLLFVLILAVIQWIIFEMFGRLVRFPLSGIF